MSRVPSSMFRKADINGTIFLQAILMLNFMFFSRQVRKWYFGSMGHYPDCPGCSRRCSGKRTSMEPCFYRQYRCQTSCFFKTSTKMVFWKYGPLSGLSRVPSEMFLKADIYGTIFLQTILVANFMFFKDKYENGILEVQTQGVGHSAQRSKYAFAFACQ